MYRDVDVRRMPRGLRQAALSIACLSPIARRPDAFVVTKIASFIFRPERRFLALTSLHSLRRPSLNAGSSSLISLRRHCFSLSRPRLRPPENVQSRSRFRLTRSVRPRFATTSFEDFGISCEYRLCPKGRLNRSCTIRSRDSQIASREADTTILTTPSFIGEARPARASENVRPKRCH